MTLLQVSSHVVGARVVGAARGAVMAESVAELLIAQQVQ